MFWLRNEENCKSPLFSEAYLSRHFVLALIPSVLVWHFLVCKISCELVGELEANLHGYMGLVTRKPVLGFSDKVRLKPVSSATGTS